VLSGRGLCVGLITRRGGPTESGVSECNREASIMRPWPTSGCHAVERKMLVLRTDTKCIMKLASYKVSIHTNFEILKMKILF
jgi:hypothetical protein